MITDEKMERLISELYEENILEMDISINIEEIFDKACKELEDKDKKNQTEEKL